MRTFVVSTTLAMAVDAQGGLTTSDSPVVTITETTQAPPSTTPPPDVITPPLPGGGLVVAEGDSITANPGSYARIYAANNPSVTVVNTAIIGSTLNDVIGRRAADLALIAANPGKGPYIYTLLIGSNDGGTIAASVSAYVQSLASHVAALKAGGFNYVVISTTLDGGIAEPYRLQLDAALLALVPGQADAIVNYRSALIGWDGANNITPGWFANTLHPSDGGYALMAPPYASVVNALFAGSRPAPVPLPGAPSYPAPRPNTLDNLTASPGPQLKFSNGNLSVASDPTTGAGGLVRTMLGKSSGKWAAEFRLDQAGPFDLIIGICDDGNFKAGFPITSTISGQAYELGTIPVTGSYSKRGTYGNIDGFSWGGGGVSSWPAFAQSDRITIAWDGDAKKAWIAHNGDWGNGNPVTGVGWVFQWLTTLAIYPTIQLQSAGDGITYMATGALYIPSGFSQLA